MNIPFRSPCFQGGNHTIVGQLMSGQADISLNGMTTCCGRTKVVDFSATINSRGFGVVFRQPDLVKDIFFVQFSARAWCVSLIFLILLSLSMLAYYAFKKSKKMPGTEEFEKEDVLLWILCKV